METLAFYDTAIITGVKDLSEKKFAVSLNAVVGVSREHVFGVGTLGLDWCWSFRFNSVASVVFIKCIDKLFQP